MDDEIKYINYWNDVSPREIVYWSALHDYYLTDEQIGQMIDQTPVCVATWTRKDGSPCAATMYHVRLDDTIYLTTTEGQAKAAAWRRNPLASVAWWGMEGAAHARGRMELVKDPALRRRVLEAMGKKLFPDDAARYGKFLRAIDAPDRVTVKVVPDKIATFAASLIPRD